MRGMERKELWKAVTQTRGKGKGLCGGGQTSQGKSTKGTPSVVETRSVLVTPRRLRCRPSTTGCYRPPRSSRPAGNSSSICTKDYACLLPPLHITRPGFIVSRLFSHHPALRGVFCFPLFAFSTLSALSRFFSHHASLPPVSHPPYKCFTLSYTLPNSTATVPPLPVLFPCLTTPHGFVSPRGRVFKRCAHHARMVDANGNSTNQCRRYWHQLCSCPQVAAVHS